MANQVANKSYWTFNKGFITETSPLLFPEGASIDEENFVLKRDGSRRRRFGMNIEFGGSLLDTGKPYASLSATAISTFLWKSPNSISSIALNVAQISNTLYFFDANAEAQSNALHCVISLGGGELYSPIHFTAISGVLICASNELGVFSIELDIPDNRLPAVPGSPLLGYTKSPIDLKIRDVFGVEDGLRVDERPDVLSVGHKYNLMNQGWDDVRINATRYGGAWGVFGIGVYPSNADIWHIAKNSLDFYDPLKLANTHIGSSKAPVGRFIIDAFNRGASRESKFPTVYFGTLSLSFSLPANDKETGKISCVEAYSGRVFYSGVSSKVVGADNKSPNYTGFVFYSKLLTSKDDLDKCYSEADPTSEQISDLIPSDGGFIVIPDANNIVALKEIAGGLLVFAENGVWVISGTDKGFSATDNMVKKVTDVGCKGAGSVVVVEGSSVLYWSDSGIYSVTGDLIDGFSATNVTLPTIQSYYDSIPTGVKEKVKGVYDKVAKRVHWMYTTSEGYSTSSTPYLFDKELVLDVALQAFYKNTTPSSIVYVPAIVEGTGKVNNIVYDDIVLGADTVVVGGVPVVTKDVEELPSSTGIKYLALQKNPSGTVQFTFSSYNDSSFVDWKFSDGVGTDSEAYLISGYELLQDSMRNKQVEYIVFHFNRTEQSFVATEDGIDFDNPSSCLVQTRFDFSDSDNGRWSSEMQAYRLGRYYQIPHVGMPFDYGQSVITTKNKVRGRGRAISYRIRSEPAKDLQLLGWSVMYSGNSSV